MSVETSPRIDFDPYAEEFIQDPYPFYKRLRDEAPFFWSEKFNMRVLTRFADVQSAARDWQTFTSTKGLDLDGTSDEFLGVDFIAFDPPVHGVWRNLFKGPFQPGAIKGLEPGVRARAEQLLDAIEPGQPFDPPNGFAHHVTISTILGLLGLPQDDVSVVAEGLNGFLDRVPGEGRLSAESLESARRLRDYLLDACRERRVAPKEDFLSTIAATRVDGELLSETQLAGLCLFLLNAGVETATSTTTSALFWLHEHPDQRRMLAEDPAGLPAAIEEVVRFDAPLTHFLRVTTREVELYGETVPENTRVMLVYAAANRDDRRWDDPDRFDVTREPQRHLGFGEGPHFCLGAPLARLQVRVMLELVLARMPEYKVVGPAEMIIKENQHGFRSLPVVA
jgi:cytochrome P450